MAAVADGFDDETPRSKHPHPSMRGGNDGINQASANIVSKHLRQRSRRILSHAPAGAPSLEFLQTMRTEEEAHELALARRERSLELSHLNQARAAVRISILFMWLACLGVVTADIGAVVWFCAEVRAFPTFLRLGVGATAGVAPALLAATGTSRWARRQWTYRGNR